jgi:hypothetical protein
VKKVQQLARQGLSAPLQAVVMLVLFSSTVSDRQNAESF